MKTVIRQSRSFLSLYFLLILTFISASWLLDEVWSQYLEQDIESYTGYKTMLHAIEDYLARNPAEEWEELLANAAKRYELPLKLESIDSIRDTADKTERRELRKGNTYVYYDDNDVELHHLISGTNTIITLGPTKLPTRPRAEALVRVFVLLAIALIILGWLLPISRDLDQLKKATDKLGDGNFELEIPQAKSSMMASLMSGFNIMAVRIKRLIDAHKELTNAVSHELRTPLARTKFALQMLGKMDDAEKRQKYITHINEDIHELESLVNELLVYAALDCDRPELDFKQTDVCQLVEHQVSLNNEFCDEITTDMPDKAVFAKCDRHFIERALSNYISNAIKYGKGKVKISVASDEKYCTVIVEDDGCGVEGDLKTRVFDAFSRGDESRNKETGGFGLGLAIVKRVLEWHEGETFIQDSELGGAKFGIRWPIK
ncbi:ATP-binding protein [Thalassotalea euphylliae]|uniref:ATP-binding protein n=1 Tax=Thalassotalea euphylliae TaxID=1655234 RepID=UPI003644CD70